MRAASRETVWSFTVRTRRELQVLPADLDRAPSSVATRRIFTEHYTFHSEVCLPACPRPQSTPLANAFASPRGSAPVAQDNGPFAQERTKWFKGLS